ncbi:phosphate starvation-inducible protein PsiF [Pseudomonas sp. UL073]|uniref:Phosphate starvation-inducible protein PsiF n=1 Tax=Zestomonas insulae TaxID=2809017 RepID=A0ABS2IE83_9GAMM|nr:PsiF family protein [Pseudomonas insulae]MBM7061277.1 phosphate starvation-inducible protein PsiF [Pseudomonas insulae]
MTLLRMPVLLLALLACSSGFAATAQQDKMTSCNANASAKALKGDERKAFMSSCLKADSKAAMTPQERMTACNKDAATKALKGDERKTFMSSCLKK